MTNDLKQRVTDAMVEAAFYANHDERIPPSKIERETVRRSIEAALSVSSSGEAAPFFYGIREPNGQPFLDEACVWSSLDDAKDAAADLGNGYEAVPLYAHPSPLSVQTTLPLDRETLGRMVREAWVRWALTQPSPKPSWLVPYDELSEPDKEADRQIGEAIAKWTVIHSEAASSVQTGVAVKALQDIAAATDADDPESYRSDDHEGCLDTVHAIAKGTLSALSSAPAPSVEELRGALEPLAQLPIGPEIVEDTDLVLYKNAGRAITVGDVLKARAALARNSDAAGEGK